MPQRLGAVGISCCATESGAGNHKAAWATPGSLAGWGRAGLGFPLPQPSPLAWPGWRLLAGSAPAPAVPRASPLRNEGKLQQLQGLGLEPQQCQGSSWCSCSWQMGWGSSWGRVWQVLLTLGPLLCALGRAVLGALPAISAGFQMDFGSLFPSPEWFQGISHVSSPTLLWVLRNFLTYKKLI